MEVSYDGGPWENAAALTVEGPRRNCDLHLVPRRCASLRLRLWGYGQITLRSLAKTFQRGKGKLDGTGGMNHGKHCRPGQDRPAQAE